MASEATYEELFKALRRIGLEWVEDRADNRFDLRWIDRHDGSVFATIQRIVSRSGGQMWSSSLPHVSPIGDGESWLTGGSQPDLFRVYADATEEILKRARCGKLAPFGGGSGEIDRGAIARAKAALARL